MWNSVNRTLQALQIFFISTWNDYRTKAVIHPARDGWPCHGCGFSSSKGYQQRTTMAIVQTYTTWYKIIPGCSYNILRIQQYTCSKERLLSVAAVVAALYVLCFSAYVSAQFPWYFFLRICSKADSNSQMYEFRTMVYFFIICSCFQSIVRHDGTGLLLPEEISGTLFWENYCRVFWATVVAACFSVCCWLKWYRCVWANAGWCPFAQPPPPWRK